MNRKEELLLKKESIYSIVEIQTHKNQGGDNKTPTRGGENVDSRAFCQW